MWLLDRLIALARGAGRRPDPAIADACVATAEQYRARLVAEICQSYPDCSAAHRLIRQAIDAIPDAADRAHAPLHEVRYLMTFAMTPPGPGLIVDIGASPVYAAPLKQLKRWTIAEIPVLALDYETDPLPYPDGSVDGVLLCEVIEHFVLDPLHCVIEINRILRPGGFVLITTPNVASWYSINQALHQRHTSRWPVYAWNVPNSRNHIHAREYLVSELEILLAAGGFGEFSAVTSDYGIAPPYPEISGYSKEHRGETIFFRARKQGQPVKRSVQPLYLSDVAYPG